MLGKPGSNPLNRDLQPWLLWVTTMVITHLPDVRCPFNVEHHWLTGFGRFREVWGIDFGLRGLGGLGV